ncbi:SsgA family sporulation/cell division regulator [Streptomyces sp. NPDC058239]|uniref:SsgA family sporulation/cell division regulator n=1 Tax=Streptomyces sp. NPDC058239 TaxID=3346395 RepID=UPI0036E45855
MSTQPLRDEGGRPPNGVITVDLAVDLVITSTEAVPLSARLVYDPQSPFTALLEVSSHDDRENAHWSFARDLLQTGLNKPSGDGDVRIWPPCRCSNRPEVRMLLRGTSGSALLDVPSEPLREWLVRTWEAVPPGEENARINWDAILSALLSS